MCLGRYKWIYACLIALFSDFAFSVDYYWRVPYPLPSTTNYSSASSACAANDFYYESANASGGFVRFAHRMDFIQVDGFRCNTLGYKLNSQGQEYLANQWSNVAQRYGDTCPSGSTYDQTKGECKSDNPCASLSGTSSPFQKSGTAPDAYMTISGGYAAPTQSACQNGCVVSTADQKCTTQVDGPYVCRGTAWYTGQSCASEPGVSPSGSSDYPEPSDNQSSTPCNYITAPDGKQTCISSRTNESEGQSCGTFNGQQICTDKPPKKDKTEIETTVSTQNNPDGSKNVTKVDVATITTCSGINSCTSKTTTITTVTHVNADGSNGSSSSSCTGSACPSKDSGAGLDGDGDGLGDCATGQECSEEIGGQDWYQESELTYAGVLGDFRNRVANAPVFASVGSFLSLNAGGTCPRATVDIWFTTLSFEALCGEEIPWTFIAAVVIAVAGFMAFRIAISS